MKTAITTPSILHAGSDQGRRTPTPMLALSRAQAHAVPGMMPELHHIAAQSDEAFRIQTLDGAIRHFICLNGMKANTNLTVYYTPDDEDGCEVFATDASTLREYGTASLYLGSGVLARIVERDGRTLTNYALPSELDADGWSDDIETAWIHYAKDNHGRLALGYWMPASGFQVINGPKDFTAVKFQVAARVKHLVKKGGVK